jgi:glycosyltransferase involved in cell wall biosynthesis
VKIAIDPWTLASRFRCQGTYVYLQNLLREFKNIVLGDSAVSFSLFASGRNGNDAVNVAPSASFALDTSRLLDYDRVWRLGGAGLSARRARADVLFIPTAATLPVGPVPAVCTIHDVTPLTMPTHSNKVTAGQRMFFQGCARFSRAIITSSECSKKDIVALLGVPEEKITVIHDACDHTIFNTIPTDPEKSKLLRSRLGIQKPYLIHHGTIQPRKNLKRLIEAFRLMLARDNNLDFDLVLVGQMGWASGDVTNAARNENGGKGRVIFTGILSDADLAMLLRGTSLAVVPSLYEGFCLPMVEAMACGVPTIASRTSCLPEISGRALKYFDPLSIEELAACMRSVLSDSALSQRLREAGVARASEFSWAQCARETLQVLLRAAGAAHN